MLAVDLAIRENAAFLKENRLLLALSGGLDSMVLAHSLLSAGIQFAAAHVNYKLRGAESDDDEAFIADFCRVNKIKYFSKTQALDSNRQGNIQNSAREIRHQFFREIISEHLYTLLLTAHHQDDRVENLLLNLMRGAGLKGLSALTIQSNNIFRPFLSLSKNDLKIFAEKHKIRWREDSSNVQNYYDRNFIRNQIIPKLEEITPQFKQNAGRSAKLLREDYKLLQYYKSQWIHNHVRNTHDEIVIDIQNTDEDLFIKSYLSELGFHPNTIEEIYRNLYKPGRQFESHNDWIAYLDRNQIIISSSKYQIKNIEATFINSENTLVPINNSLLKITRSQHQKEIQDFRNNSIHKISLDEDKIHFPLQIRAWQAGDQIRPLGMKGKGKKIQDILTDHKVALPDKSKILVLISNNEIIWVVNFCVSETVKITDRTKKIYSIEYLETK